MIALSSDRFLGVILIAGLAGSILGCGSSGVTTYEVSGTVTHQGKPVPFGEIAFEPDASKGNKGPGSIAAIEDGKFKTTYGKGVVGGAYIVRIIGFDGVVINPEASTGSPLFAPYETTADLPKESTVKDIEVP